MNEEIDETEFYHQDFTTASDWEIFISRLEEIINLWKVDELKNEAKDLHIWDTKSEKLMFVDTEFELLYYKKLNDDEESNRNEKQSNDKPRVKKGIDLDYDFQMFDINSMHEHSNLYLWYGLSEYFVLTPTGNNGVTSESKIKVLLSSLYIIVNNLNCEIPMFVQVKDKWQKCYFGVHERSKYRTNFEMIHLKRIPQHSQHLSGLLSLFTSKIMSPISLDHIISSVQFTFDLTDFGKNCWKQDIFNMDTEVLDTTSLYNMPFGVTVDPISVLQLKATWFNIPSYRVNDSQAYSDFNAMFSDQWSILVKMSEQPICLLSDCLTEYLHLYDNNSTAYDVLGELSPLDALVDSKVSNIPSILGRAARNSLSGSTKDTSAIPEEVLVPILYYLFPDAEQSETSYPYNLGDERQHSNTNDILDINKECRGFKTCPSGSLLWRLSVVSGSLQHSAGGYRAFAQLWYEFVQEMRYRWEKNIIVPGLAREFPDLRTCLLNQKLQMLNCCIERKKAREESQKELNFDSAEGSSTDDEEFFDCADKPVEETKRIQPSGRLGKFQTLKLIETGEYLYIPVTQEPVPKTEDQLDEDADVLLKLGSDAQGSELRAKMMSASLLSDMESFKAANPGAVLEDFVRWYSPRDWQEIDDEDQWGQKKGTLSNRMLIEDNIWAQMWKSAKPVPASKQKLLFVDTKEAEKVLHFLESRTLAQISELLVPILFQASIYRLAEEVTQLEVELIDGTNKLQNLIKLSERISRDNKVPARRVEAIVQEMAQLELNMSEINSLHYKLNPSGNQVEGLRESVRHLVNGKEIRINKNSEIGNRLNALFADAQRNTNLTKEESGEEGKIHQGNSVFPSPNEREFVMRVEAVKPALYSSMCPQYLRAILSKNEFRLAGAFTEDISFF